MNWIDTPLLVYSRVTAHPAQRQVAEALNSQQWASSVLALLEVYQALRVDYGQPARLAADEVEALATSPIRWMPVTVDRARSVAHERRETGLGGADAALLLLCEEDRGSLFTLDGRLLRAATERGLTASRLLDRVTMDQVHDWEQQHLPERGLPRFLRVVERWLAAEQPGAAARFTEATANLTRLPA